MPEATREFLDVYGYIEIVDEQKVITLCGDFARHMNHSNLPNVAEVFQPGIFVATRDIEEGEELTCNYSEFSLEFARKITDTSHWG